MTLGDSENKEKERVKLQNSLQEEKSLELRKALGQFATPSVIAEEIMQYGLKWMAEKEISFLEPCCGSGSFLSALYKYAANIKKCTAYEIDPDYWKISHSLWGKDKANINLLDFTKQDPDDKYSFSLINPPYVRQQLIDSEEKARLKKSVLKETGIELSGLSDLYCYFILLSHKWLAQNAICGWLIPAEFLSVNYGNPIKKYLLENVQLLCIHQYEHHTSIFEEASASSVVIWFRNTLPAADNKVCFSYGNSLLNPKSQKMIRNSELNPVQKWGNFKNNAAEKQQYTAQLGDYFEIKRGIATGDNNFFILKKEQLDEMGIDESCFKPILPNARSLKTNEIIADANGFPVLTNPKFLLNCSLPEEELKEKYQSLYKYIESGKETTATRFLCKKRKPWYKQEEREPAPFLCVNTGRKKEGKNSPFRFIRNRSNAVATNSFLLLYPKPILSLLVQDEKVLLDKLWNILQSITNEDFDHESRKYGNGLLKIEPKELNKIKCPPLR